MDKEKELERIVDTLIAKGYDGYVMAQRDTVGKLREIVADYMDGKIKNRVGGCDALWLLTYISWSADGKQFVSCDMWLKENHGKMGMDKMIIEKHANGSLVRKSELNKLSLDAVPTTKKAIELVSDVPKHKPLQEKKGRQRH
ncbi:hypothetical protein ATE47_01230 [Chryseobacterium sp. IHB B 17019]|uniref:hypothetical protein n=1 Tax=Chryseobacterium sp. IHB B 17019 TaxID=1721091 RepID=UPI0007226774|nr:hypothetical protein [Chryseobacterium sp. IHB B 17019]ALR29236.1 hypothetical protein ATE47_01230 [Chryseobacterium sp. IHB B 17019]